MSSFESPRAISSRTSRSGSVRARSSGLAMPGLLVSAIGSTVLGIALVRARYRPRVTSWLLALAFPSILVVPAFLGNLSLGLVPLLVAWGATGLRLWREGEPARGPGAAAADPA